MAVATIVESTLVGDQIRVVLKLPAGVSQPDRGYFIPAAVFDPKAAIASAARPAVKNDVAVKNNLAALAPGTTIDLTDPVVDPPPTPPPPPTPTADDLAVSACAGLVLAYRIAKNKAAVGLPGVDVQAAAASVVTAYTNASKAAQARMDALFGGFS